MWLRVVEVGGAGTGVGQLGEHGFAAAILIAETGYLTDEVSEMLDHTGSALLVMDR